MEIKILCECGVKFKFDVEPRDGRSPGPVHCPSCGKEQTAATDEKIREQLAPAPAVAGPSSVAAPQASPATPQVSIPAVRIPTAGGSGAQVSPKMAVMAVPATSKPLSVKPPGEQTAEPAPAVSAPAASSEPKAAGSPKMAYMPVPEATKALSVKPPGEAVEEHAAPAQIASTSNAPGSPKMAKMEVPTGGTALSVASHAKKEDVSPSPQVPAPTPAVAHPAAGRVSAAPKRESSSDSKGPGQVIGLVIGLAVGFYCGLMMAIPGVAAMIAGAIAKKVSSERFLPFVVPLSVILGHNVWLLMALAVAPAAAIPDLILAAIGVIWLCARPGKGVVWFFTVFEGISLLINVGTILAHEFGTAPHKALVAHIALRAFIIVSLWSGLRQARRNAGA